MIRFKTVLVSVLALGGFVGTVQAREAQSNHAPSAQAPAAQQPVAKRSTRKLRRAGSSTAGADSFLPALGGIVAQLGATGAIAAAGGFASGAGPASPE